MDNVALQCVLLVQIFMGGLDTVYHHELTERLAWRSSQKQELKLHGIRNLIYALFFVYVGFFSVNGWLAVVIIAALLLEMGITMVDFVEEDRTRKLPATERVLHTLLTLNYGVVLALLLPILFEAAQRSASVDFEVRGFFSLCTVAAAIGVVIFGVRDILASKRLSRLQRVDAEVLMNALPGRRSVLVTGGTGFIGQKLVMALVRAGHNVTVLSRNVANVAGLPAPMRVVTDLRQIADNEKFDAIVNFAGKPIIGGLWTGKFRRQVLFSRLRLSAKIRQLVGRLHVKPEVVINASAVGAYGVSSDAPFTEYSAIQGDGSFSNRSCAMIERHANRLRRFGVRVVNLRIGLVLDTDGGVLANMLFPFEFGIGGNLGNGAQWMSWISRDDVVRLIGHIMIRPELEGAVNATAPHPVRNCTFTQSLGRALNRPAVLPVPAPLLRQAGDLGKEIFLSGQHVLPTRALETGFIFHDPLLEPLLERLVGKKTHAINPMRENQVAARGVALS